MMPFTVKSQVTPYRKTEKSLNKFNLKKFLNISEYSSVNLYNKIRLLMQEQIEQMAKGIRWTLENCPEAVLIGGTAVVCYLDGNRDLTPDLDFMISGPDDLIQIIQEQNINYRNLVNSNNEKIGISLVQFNTDFLYAEEGISKINSLVLSYFRNLRIGGFSVKIAEPELLAIAKLELGRDKDMEDAFALIQSGKLTKEKFTMYCRLSGLKFENYEILIK